ncbi:MAG TPA: hypothetical protein VFQ23_25675, partial [Anaerolineales bacterium]|nr:hypothetical protein [Anaerolineales bacterium]
KFPLDARFLVCGRLTDNERLKGYSFYYLHGEPESVTQLRVSQEYPDATRLFRSIYGVITGFILILLIVGFIRDINRATRK